MSSRLPCYPHPRTTKKASASAVAVQLLLRHRGGRAAAKDESIEFFSALSGQTDERAADRRGKAKLRAEIGKHDYDWLLTPPATPLSCSPPLSRLTRATSASHAKSNSPLSRGPGTQGEREQLRAQHDGAHVRPPAVRRTLSSASSSSVKATSKSSGRSTPATSPRTPAAATARQPRPRDKTYGRQQVSSGSGAASQPKGSSSSTTGPLAPRPRAPTIGASSPKSTRVASEQPALTRRGANAVARSRFAGQLSHDAMSTAQAAENAVPPSMVKTRPVPATVKQSHGNGTAALSTSPATAASRSASRGDLLASKRLPRSGGDGRKIHDEKAAPRRAVGFGSSAASTRRCLTKTDSRKLTVNEGAQQRSIRSVASGSRLGFAATVSDAGSIARGRRSTAEKDKVAVAAATPVAVPDAFPSTRYDAMLLREDPKNLTWLNGCGEDDDNGEDGSCGAGLVDGSLEPFHVTSGTAARL